MLSAAVGVVSPLAQVPNEAALSYPSFANEWYFNNTGQTLTDAVTGPANATAGADIDATDAWDLTTGSSNVVIAVLDTGADLTNSDLAANLWTNPGNLAGDTFVNDIHGWNFVDNNNNVQDDIGHGTTTSSVIGAVGNNGVGVTGVAWNVKLLEVKVGDASGVSDANLIAGINYIDMLKQAGVNIVAINASYFSVGAMSPADFSAIQSAGDHGILYIAAAGNVGLNLDTLVPGGFLPSNLIFVAATDDQDNLASFSDYGANTVALAAPGVDIITTAPGGFDIVVSGTSYSAPMVSGTVALMKSLDPGASMGQLEAALFAGADAVPALSGDTTHGRLDAYKSLEILLGDQVPVGSVGVLNATTVSGWAYDFNAGLKPVTVALLIDGAVAQTASANVNRADLTAAVGSPDHAYSFTLPALTGTHTIEVLALDFSPFTALLPVTVLGGGTVGGPTPPIGTVVGNAATVSGWVIDPNTPATSVTIQVNVDGTPFGTYVAANSRPDLTPIFGSANHGYSVPLTGLAPAFHRIDVYAFDTTTGMPTLIGSRTVNGNLPATGVLGRFNGSTFVGWAIDPDSPATSINIEYTVDGAAPITTAANVSRPDLVPLFGSADHGFSVTLPQLPAGPHTVAAYAVDADTGALTSLGSITAIVANPAGQTLPVGVFGAATTTMVKGWAYNPALGAAPIEVRVDVDGVAGTPFFANINRPDLTPVIGSPDHGFQETLSLSAGAHSISVYAIGASSQPVFLGRRIVGEAVPVGSMNLSASLIKGWAFSTAAGANPLTVRLLIDGVAGPVLTANLDRPDLTSIFGSPDHGFSIATPDLAPGVHSVTLLVIDPDSLQPVTVMTGSLTV